MEITGYVIEILDDRIVVELSRSQKIDVFITPSRKILLDKHIVIKGSLIKFHIILQTIESKGDKFGKLWLNYIIFPTETVRKEEKNSKYDGRNSWAESRVKKN